MPICPYYPMRPPFAWRAKPGTMEVMGEITIRSARPGRPELREFDDKISAVRSQKEAAIEDQEFEKAASLRDEEKNLGDCLRSAEGLFDEIIVLDTGSTDRTKEIAHSLGARVFEFPWVDSFAAARNESIGHATGD